MIKEGRKPSMDPVQEKLRQSKATWNKEVSAFLNDVIHLKKMMNGWPSKYYKERSKITMPIPGDPANVLNSLANKFQELAQQGDAIAQQQVQYSQGRRKPRPQQATETLNKLDEKYGPTTPEVAAPLTPPTSTPAADLTKQLGATFEQKYDLVAEGSNPFSRFLARLKTPQMGFGVDAQRRRLRMDMLKAAIRSYRALGRMQVHVTKSSKESVVAAYKDMQLAWNEWSIVSRNFNNYVNSMPEVQAPRSEDMKDEPPPGTEPDLEGAKPKPAWKGFSNEELAEMQLIALSMSDVQKNANKFANNSAVKSLINFISTLKKVPMQNQMEWFRNFEKQYKGVLQLLNTSLGTNGISLSEVAEQLNKSKTASVQLEVVAQAFLQKWLGKTRHQLLPGKSSGLRLQMFELAAKARKSIDAVMDLLEKGMSIEELGPAISEVSGYVNTIRSLMRSLHNTEKPPGKGQAPLEGFF